MTPPIGDPGGVSNHLLTQTTPGVEPPRDPVRAGEVGRPDAGAEAVLGRVRARDRIVLVAPALDHRDGAEDLLARDRRPALGVGEDRRRDEVAVRELAGELELLAAEPELDALGLRALDVRRATRSRCAAVTSGPSCVSGSSAWPTRIVAGGLGEAVEERVVDVLVHEQARGGEADLAVREEDPEQRVLDGRLEVGVGADEHRALAAELHQRRRELLRGRGHDPPRRDAAAREADLGDARDARRARRRPRGRSR